MCSAFFCLWNATSLSDGFSAPVLVNRFLWNFSPVLAFLLLAALSAYAFFWHGERWKEFQNAAYGLLVLAPFILLMLSRHSTARDYPESSGISISGYVPQIACLTLPLSALLCWLATRFVPRDFSEFREASLPKDVGRCAKCQIVNSTASTKCRECGAVLPWAEPKPKAKTAKTSSLPAAPRVSLPTVDGSSFKTAFSNGLTFLFCLSAPILGYFLWKYLDKEDSPYASSAIIGSIAGILFYVGRFAWRFIQAGASISS